MMPSSETVLFEKIHPDALLPARMSEHAAGFDLMARLDESICLSPGERVLVGTGLKMAIPSGMEAQVRPRSGLALKHGISVLNSPGTIDSDYRGEIGIILINHGTKSFEITSGMRVAQVVFSKLCPVFIQEADDLEKSERGSGGFGSTGV